MKKDELERAYAGLERETPDWMARYIRWLHSPKSRLYRIPIGLLLIACGVVGFLPIVGYEFIPLGLLVLAQDIPFLRKPVGKMVLWLLGKWRILKKRWKHSHPH
ncbi:MAG TPA: hypothetical protein VEA39_00335 [Methylophilaceae bacterium]|nr:hypothetical protein [Methylophilaceae bacterium]